VQKNAVVADEGLKVRKIIDDEDPMITDWR
jgi:hypothetical protein